MFIFVFRSLLSCLPLLWGQFRANTLDFNHLAQFYHMKKENRFKNQVFACSVQNSDGKTITFYQTAKNRMECYEEICRLYPVRAGYSRRFVNEQV